MSDVFFNYPESGTVQWTTVSAAACFFTASVHSEMFMEGFDFNIIKVTDVKIDFNILIK
jgi:hypothetical protein